MKHYGIIYLLVVGTVTVVRAQDETGIRFSNFVLSPRGSMTAAYDDRVVDGPLADGDFYGEAEAGATLYNLPALYDIYAAAFYGYRTYNEYDGLNDDFYSGTLAVSSRDNPLQGGLRADYRKSFSYNTDYNPAQGQNPDSILDNTSNKRLQLDADAAYDWAITEQSSLRPGYALNYYKQEFDTGRSAEWQIHRIGLQYRRGLVDRYVVYVGAGVSFQVNDDEDGIVSSIVLGIEEDLTEKLTWGAELGYALADYENSGQDSGGVSTLRAAWQATDKISTYAFAGNDFQPGYQGGAARWVARIGYGINWAVLEKVDLRGTALHDYQEAIGSNPEYDQVLGEVRTFLAASANYRFTERFSSELGYRHNNDEKDPEQNIVFVNVAYTY